MNRKLAFNLKLYTQRKDHVDRRARNISLLEALQTEERAMAQSTY